MMKPNTRSALAACLTVILLLAFQANAQIPVPTATISTTISPPTVNVADNVTVSIRMANYLGAIQIDSFNFQVNYDPSAFSFVSNSFNLGTSSGADQQWLSKPPQESVSDGFSITNISNTVIPGNIYVVVGDVGINHPEYGTTAGTGFLISFQLHALRAGGISITLAPYLDGSLLLDTDLQAVSLTAQLNGATAQVLDNPVPSVALNTPSEGSLFSGPVKISLSATASSSNASISKVEFFTETTNKLGEATSAPYSINWTNPPTGAHTLTAKATDTFGAYSISLPVHITINALPSVAITSPTNNTIFNSPASITINATATTPTERLQKSNFIRAPHY